MAKPPRFATDDDGFQIASDAGDLSENHEIGEDDDLDDADFEEEDDDLEDDGDSVDDDDTDDEEDSDDDDDEDDDDDGTSATTVPKVKRGEKPKKQTAAERIEELAEKRRKAESEAFDAEMALQEERRRNDELEARLAKLENGGGQQTTTLKEPNPEDFEYGKVDDKYIEATIEYRLAKERETFQNTQRDQETERSNAEKAEHYKKRLAIVSKEGNKRFKDFDKIVESVNFPGEVAREILDSDFGVDISYYLAKNVGKLREVSLMSPAERTREMGRLEERFSARASAGKKRTKAPDTPGKKQKRKPVSKDEKQFGPENQDDFDRAFFGR